MSLRARQPGYAVMQKCLEIQSAAPSMTRAGRFFGRHPLTPEARSWYKGAQGERLVARVLESLGPEWTVLHAVPVGSGASDIDHVLIGPTGVFTINTKNHADKNVFVGGGAFMVNGRHTDHMRNAVSESTRAADLLFRAAGTWTAVQPLIVVAGARQIRFGKKKPTVVVLTATQLRRWVLSLPRRLSTHEIDYLTMFAVERATWHVRQVVINDTLRHVQRFERLERAIAEAARRRRLWTIGVIVGALGLPVLVGCSALAAVATLGR